MYVKKIHQDALVKKYAVRLVKGENVMQSLKSFGGEYANKNLCQVEGIGALKNIRMGFASKNEDGDLIYSNDLFTDDHELLSLKGNISSFQDGAFPHIHVTISDENYQVKGGHLHEAEVAVTVELFITVSNEEIKREYDEETGLNLLKL
jgi:predicted DNA-binding protein with PD1-like motif